MRWRWKGATFLGLLALVIGAGLWLRHRAVHAPAQSERSAGADAPRANAPAAELAVGATDSGAMPSDFDSFDPAARPEAEAGAPPVSIEGRVTDTSGNGVPRARVAAVARAALANVLAANEKLLDIDPVAALHAFQTSFAEIEQALPSVATGDDGRYALRGLPDGDHRVVVTHAEFLTHAEENWILVQAGTKAEYDVELVAGQTIAGTVRDLKGAPIAGARVRAAPVATARLRGIGQLVQVFIAQSEGRPLFAARPVETDARGMFRLTSLEPGAYDLRVARERYAWAEARGVSAGTEDVAVVLAPAFRVAGRVVSLPGAPIAKAQVVLREPGADIHGPDGNMTVALRDIDIFGEKERAGITDAEGRFELHGFTRGAYELGIRAEGFAERVEPATLDDAPLDLGDIVLEDGRELRGVVLSAQGEPIAGAEVWVPRPPRRNGDRDSRRLAVLEAGPASSIARTQSGANGAFRLAGLGGDAHELAAFAEGYPGDVFPNVAAGGEAAITLRRGVTIGGIVVDAESGDPLPGARVETETWQRKRQTSDARGFFEFTGVAPDSERSFGATAGVRASRDGYRDARALIVFPDRDAPQTINVRLALQALGAGESETTVAGIVRGARGEPLAGALVWAEVPGLPRAFLRIGFFGSRDAETRTADDGTFTLPAPQFGNMSFAVLASLPGYATARAGPFAANPGENGRTFVELSLGRGASIAGRVTSAVDGAPIAGARIRLWRDPQVPDETTLFTQLLPRTEGEATYSGGDGAFRLRRIEPGAYWIEARAQGHAAKTLGPIQVAPEHGAAEGDRAAPESPAVSIDIALEAGASLAGRVVDAEGGGLPGVEIVALPVTERDGALRDADNEIVLAGALGAAQTVTGADGAYRLEHLPAGTFHVLARARGFEPAWLSPVVPGQPVPDLALLPCGSIAGRVRDAETGQPVAEFSVSFEWRNAVGEFQAAHRYGRDVRDDAGWFACEGMHAGDWLVSVASETHLPWRGETNLAPGGTIELDIALNPGRRIEGAVVRPDGTPIPDAALRIRLVSRPNWGGQERRTRSGDDGAFVGAGLEPGAYRIEATHPGFYAEESEAAANVDLDAAEVASARLVLHPAGKILGRVRGLGAARPGEDLWIVRFTPIPADPGPAPTTAAAGTEKAAAPRGAPFECQADAWGLFQRDSVRPGGYLLDLTHKRSVEDPERPGGKWVVIPEDCGPLGEVAIRAGESALFEGEAP